MRPKRYHALGLFELRGVAREELDLDCSVLCCDHPSCGRTSLGVTPQQRDSRHAGCREL